MDDFEINLIPLWELIIERISFTHINYSFHNDDAQKRIVNSTFTKSLLHFVPTVSPYYYTSLREKKQISIEWLLEALKHSMNSVAVENPKLYLDWSPKKVIDLEKLDDSNNEVFNLNLINNT